eukprot:GGOE01040822.1.p1 GENE.GGOE01040822.1~~GGOE01040822.1.p1  ORF type:complete len:190 (+),score=18.59 GGOE01040822.1:27-572(+)
MAANHPSYGSQAYNAASDASLYEGQYYASAHQAPHETSQWSADDQASGDGGWTTTHYVDGDTEVIKQTYSTAHSSSNAWTNYHPSEEGGYGTEWPVTETTETVSSQYDEERQYETSSAPAPLPDWKGVEVGAQAPPSAATALHHLLPGSQAPQVVQADTSSTIGPDGKKVTRVSYVARANW